MKIIPHLILSIQLVADQKALIAQVQDFQEGVRTRMKQKYSRNHKVVIFQPEDIVTLRIPKEDRAATDNHRVVVMIKSIPHEGRHEIQTRFGVLDRFYPTGELNIIPSVDQESYRSSFIGVPTKPISLHAVAAKIGTSNKVAVHCSCKKCVLLSLDVNVGRVGFSAPNIVTILAMTAEMRGPYKKVRKPWFCQEAKMIVKWIAQ